MGQVSVEDIVVTPLKRISTAGGDVLHAIRRSEPGFAAFGEAYFSEIEVGAIKAWKRHTRMTLNLVVPLGRVRFVFSDESALREEQIGDSRYARLTVPPGIWFGFQGLSAPRSLVLNVADIEHDPGEVERANANSFNHQWERVS